MSFDKKYLIWALAYAVIGMSLGIFMAVSGNHGELVAHAHILLIGFAVSFFYALIHRLWLSQPGKTLRQPASRAPDGFSAGALARAAARRFR